MGINRAIKRDVRHALSRRWKFLIVADRTDHGVEKPIEIPVEKSIELTMRKDVVRHVDNNEKRKVLASEVGQKLLRAKCWDIKIALF